MSNIHKNFNSRTRVGATSMYTGCLLYTSCIPPGLGLIDPRAEYTFPPVMSERKKPYPFDVFEPKWQQIGDERKTFKVNNPGEEGFDASKPKYLSLIHI